MKPHRVLSCPSGQPDMPGARVFGVATGPEHDPQIAWLAKSVPVTPGLLAKTGEIEPQRVFRIAVTCQESRCVHFDGARCQLAGRIVALLPAVTERLPACTIRSTCRWFNEQGAAACRRCPQVLTHSYDPPARIVDAAGPA